MYQDKKKRVIKLSDTWNLVIRLVEKGSKRHVDVRLFSANGNYPTKMGVILNTEEDVEKTVEALREIKKEMEKDESG